MALVPIFMQLGRIFQLMPSFGIYNDGRGKGNAKALKKSPINRPDGTVSPDGMIAFGATYFTRLKTGDAAAIAAVCAHEFGHLLQYKYINNEIMNMQVEDNSVARIELHADFICGYFGGVQAGGQLDYPAAIHALNQFRSGENLDDPNLHHGTPEERANAVREGFRVAAKGNALLPSEIVNVGLDYVRKLQLWGIPLR
jgi:hypothetical protein